MSGNTYLSLSILAADSTTARLVGPASCGDTCCAAGATAMNELGKAASMMKARHGTQGRLEHQAELLPQRPSTSPRVALSRIPSCSCKAVKSEGPSGSTGGS